MKEQPLVITRGAQGISQAGALDDIHSTPEAPFDEQTLAVTSGRLTQKEAIVLFETKG